MTQAAFVGRIGGVVHAAPAVGERFTVLDTFRGLCALLVALFHFPTSSAISQNAFVGASYLFVDFFFVLSGFVIASSYADRLSRPDEVARFGLVRFGRLYPLHLFMLMAFAAFEALRLVLPPVNGGGDAPFTGAFDFQSLLANLFLLQGMGVEDQLTWNGPSWSISVEFFAYLLFAGIVLAAGRRAWIGLAAAVVVAPAVLLAFSKHHMDVSYDLGFVRCFYGFSLGALLSLFRHDAITAARRSLSRSANRTIWTLAEFAMMALIVLFVTLAGDNDFGIAAPVVFVAALYLFAHEAGAISALLRNRAMLMLGTLSYSIYMIHLFVQGRMINAGGILEKVLHVDLVGDLLLRGEPAVGFGPQSPWIGLAAALSMLCLVVAASWFTWRFVEMPALGWFRRLAKRI
ncbi:acyltransferase family protein [Mesorhizobium sp. A623]